MISPILLIRQIELLRREFEGQAEGANSEWINGVLHGIQLVKKLVYAMQGKPQKKAA